MIEESVSKGQDFNIGSVLVSGYSPFVVPVALTNHVWAGFSWSKTGWIDHVHKVAILLWRHAQGYVRVL